MNRKLRLPLVFVIVSLLTQNIYAQSEFWGTTRWGGTNSMGVVFKTNNDGTNPQEVYSFSNGTDGGDPHGGLIQAGNGKLYGVTFMGGAYDYGVLYEIDPINGNFTKKFDFDSINSGAKCMGTLFEASNGKLYGMTWAGGANNDGVIFEYDIPSNTLVKIIDLDANVNGSNPLSNTLMEASNGKLYGTVTTGGANNAGILFEYDYTSGIFTKKLDFLSATSGSAPGGRLTEVAPGILYGATRYGGATGDGLIFEYDINTNILTNKYSLDGNITGNRIYDGLMLASNGKLYGLAQGAGPSYQGTMIEFDIASSLVTKVVDFGALDTGLLSTWEPYGSPMQASNGKIYATSAYGSNGGDLFEYDIVTDTYIALFDFDAAINASGPYYLRLIEVNTPPANVWPGDCNYDLIVDNTDFLNLGLAWNETGPTRPGASINWVAQPATVWTGSFPNSLNYKHADTNGDGVVSGPDSAAIYQNYGLTHAQRLGNNAITSAGEFFLVPSASAVAPGQPVTYEIHLSDASAPISTLYGVAFTLSYDQALVDTNQVVLDYSTSTLGNLGTNMISFEKNFYSQGKTDAALVRTDQVDASNVFGVLGTFTVTTHPGVSTLSNLVITPSDITLINTGGIPITLTPVQNSVTIDPALSGIEDHNHSSVSMYPNPVNSVLNIKSQSIINDLEITDVKGQLVYHNLPEANSLIIPTTSFNQGIYFLKIISEKGVTNLKVMIQH